MQSEPIAESHRTALNSSSQNLPDSYQHGYRGCDDHRVSEPLPHGGLRDPADVVASSAEGQIHASLNRLDSRHSPGGMTGSPRKSADSVSTLMALAGQQHVSLETLPNEVLTHVLSHLPPPSLSAITLVSRRFHSLVTTPHAWRIAFSRYFPGPFSADASHLDQSDHFVSDRRSFARLTALASWRSEYILRTRLLRSLSRGKPVQFEPPKRHGTVRSANVRHGSAVATYTSQLVFPVSHIDGSFGTEVTKQQPLFVHGAAEQGIASASDPSSVKVGSWGVSDFQRFRHFADLYQGEAEYGLGSGNMVGLPNRMDVSQPYGMIYGEACPLGRTYFISSTEHRGRFLGLSESTSLPRYGIPALNAITTSVCAVWIAKSSQILKMTGGLFGMLSGTSSGVLTAYALGPHPSYEKRFERGQATAKWVLCPGVPIVAIAVDDKYSANRHARGRIWAAALNALGEVFYLTDLPQQPEVTPPSTPEDVERLAWKTGRSVQWGLVELSRRTARPDPFSRDPVDGSYSPRSSSDSMKLDEHQIAAETREIEKFLSFKPKHFRKVCEGWDMKRELMADFAGDDGQSAGETLVVIGQGSDEGRKASIRRYTRRTLKQKTTPGSSAIAHDRPESSIFGGTAISTPESPPSRASGRLNNLDPAATAWFLSDFAFGDRKSVQVSASALDLSIYAVLTMDEDPLLGMSGGSGFSSAMSSPLPHMKQPSSRSEVPGQRARYIAVGTTTGSIFVWDIRSATTQNPEIINSVAPLCVIHTDSPQVTCVALTSLYLVHGGNDGLVQAWDPLASSTRPIRTINSRFSLRARRRLVQAEASLNGVGNNFFAAGALALDPDPTILRGMVGLGTHLRYWAYSSTAADQYKSGKRRLRRGKRGSNSPEGHRFNSSGRGALQSHIDEEMVEMERQEVASQKEKAHLSSRFGIDLLGPDVSEEQVVAYAQLLSEESFTGDAIKRGENVDSSVTSASFSDTVGPNDSSAQNDVSSSSSPLQDGVDDDLAPDIAEAIRLSLLDEGSRPFEEPSSIPMRNSDEATHYASSQAVAGNSRQQEMDELEFAVQLSLAEEQNHGAPSEQEQFPALGSPESSGKNKGKGRAL